ncbi:MAG: hypothetical protein M4D80_09920 [Myxococcota bacterium]|nr:hypothetical protein [Deltaproteobacteria bacterium]MDQ3335470.1 hypothetical protein [Myxococcota bacterium]
MIRLLVTALTFTLFTGVATADRKGRGDKGRGDNRHDNRPVVREHRGDSRAQPQNRGNRRVVHRGPVRANNGRFVFAGGVTHVYSRPVIRARYTNQRVRPAYVVENFTPVPGYVWVRGGWTWSGAEWRWGGGYYAADPQYTNYYTDGSFDLRVNVNIGG